MKTEEKVTAGTTPIQFYGLSPSGCLVEDDDGDWVEADAYRQLERELAAVRAAGNHIGDANEMVAAVRKSAGAELPPVMTSKQDAKETQRLSQLERRDLIGEVTLWRLRYEELHRQLDERDAAKSTPGVDAVETAVAWIEEMSRVGEYPHLGSKDDCNSYDSLIERKAEVIAKLRAKQDAGKQVGGAHV